MVSTSLALVSGGVGHLRIRYTHLNLAGPSTGQLLDEAQGCPLKRTAFWARFQWKTVYRNKLSGVQQILKVASSWRHAWDDERIAAPPVINPWVPTQMLAQSYTLDPGPSDWSCPCPCQIFIIKMRKVVEKRSRSVSIILCWSLDVGAAFYWCNQQLVGRMVTGWIANHRILHFTIGTPGAF